MTWVELTPNDTISDTFLPGGEQLTEITIKDPDTQEETTYVSTEPGVAAGALAAKAAKAAGGDAVTIFADLHDQTHSIVGIRYDVSG